MTQPMLNGRLLPPNDWEGDDATPGAHGAYVTCQDVSAGRMLYYATNGDVDLDGQAIRAAIVPRDSDGVSLSQVAGAIVALTYPDRMLRWETKTLAEMRAWLAAGLGLVVDGYYGAIPRAWRKQARADFNHAIWISHYDAPNYRVWDPLNKNLDEYGEWVPASAIEPFMRSLSGLCGWINLEPQAPPSEGNPMVNLVPVTCRRVVDLRAGTVLQKTPGGDTYTTLAKAATLGLLGATSTHYQVADGDYGVYVPRAGITPRTADLNAGV